MRIVVLGIDLGKNVCSLAGLDETGAVVLRRRMKRASVLPFTARLETCTVAMEACCGAHHLGRQLVAQGHVVRLMSPAYVQPYVKAQKNDERDAEAIAEAATRPTMRYVEIKSEAQLEVQSLHRIRARLVAERTALINQLRALMLERGIAVPQGRCKLAGPAHHRQPRARRRADFPLSHSHCFGPVCGHPACNRWTPRLDATFIIGHSHDRRTVIKPAGGGPHA
jgi:transposase